MVPSQAQWNCICHMENQGGRSREDPIDEMDLGLGEVDQEDWVLFEAVNSKIGDISITLLPSGMVFCDIRAI